MKKNEQAEEKRKREQEKLEYFLINAHFQHTYIFEFLKTHFSLHVGKNVFKKLCTSNYTPLELSEYCSLPTMMTHVYVIVAHIITSQGGNAQNKSERAK